MKSTLKKIAAVAAAAVVLAALAALGWKVYDRATEKAPEIAPLVRAVKVMVVGDSAVRGRTFPGKAEAVLAVPLSFRVGGPLLEVKVERGDFVRKGDVLAKLDPRDYEVRIRETEAGIARLQATLKAMRAGARAEDIAALEAQLRAAKAKRREAELAWKRVKDLYEKGSAPRADYDRAVAARDAAAAAVEALEQNLAKAKAGARAEDIEAAEASLKALEAKLESARNALADTVLKAPFDGWVERKFVEDFQMVSSGTPIVLLADHSAIEVAVDVPEDLIHAVAAARTAICRFPALGGLEVRAAVCETASSADPMTLTYKVKVRFRNDLEKPVLPGMSADVRFELVPPDEGGEVFELPPEAVFEREGSPRVWLLPEGESRVRSLAVEVVGTGERGLLVKGLKRGARIVAAGAQFLSEGQEVRVYDPEKWKGAR